MKKLLSLLSVLTISGTATPTTIDASPYQKEEKLNSNINYQQANNLENLNRSKRQYQQDISNYVTQTNLGTIRAGSSSGGRISDLRILNQFVRLNPNLPLELRATSQRAGAIIYVSVNYGDRAIIEVHSGTQYTGYVQVTFNGGQVPSEINNSSWGEPSNWHSRLNLSRITYLNRNLGNIIGAREENIIQTFVFNNQSLPSELVSILRIRNITNNSAEIYVPEGNLRYEGNVIVSFSSRNINIWTDGTES